MSSSTSVQIKGVTLQAREEKRLPPGQPPTSNRDIGFASVFLQLENAKEADVDVIVQSIQIRSTDLVGSLQMESQNPQTIHLHPLEHSANDIQLTNKTGFGSGSVKAIVTCKIGDRVQVIESNAVTVDRR